MKNLLGLIQKLKRLVAMVVTQIIFQKPLWEDSFLFIKNPMMIGEKIRLLRKKKGLTQEEVAEYLHISQPSYARVEKGEGNSWASHLEQLCILFEASASELFNTDNFIFNQNVKGSNNGYTVNQLSEKLIDQYQARIKEKDCIIKNLREQLSKNA